MHQLLPRGTHVLVAVSGGQDSLCMAQLLLDLTPHLGVRLSVGHCDHRIRADSAACAAYVGRWAAERGLEFFQEVADAAPTNEGIAREWRYGALERLARAAGCSHVAVGHTATDRAETMLLNMMRGTGTAGLASMRWQRPLGVAPAEGRSGGGGGHAGAAGGADGGGGGGELVLVRPLLDVTRERTGEECRRRRLGPWEDPTNYDVRIARNAVRHRILPIMGSINSRAVEHMASLAEALGADVEYLEEASRELLLQARELAAAGAARAAAAGEPWPLRRRRRRPAVVALHRTDLWRLAALRAAKDEACAPPGPTEDSGAESGSGSCGSGNSGSRSGGSGACCCDGCSGVDRALHRAHLRTGHIAMQRRALLLWLRGHMGSAPTFELVEEARRLLDAPSGSRSSTLRGGGQVEVQGPLLLLRGRCRGEGGGEGAAHVAGAEPSAGSCTDPPVASAGSISAGVADLASNHCDKVSAR